MLTLTPEEFLDYLKRSELLEPKEYDDAVATIKREAPQAFDAANLLAAEFVKRNLLTSWHTRQLMKRKYKGFYLRQYRILGHLGSGGMSSVYLGEHTVMKRRVAIKVLPKKKLNPTYLDRFAREAQAIATLDSEHIVRAYDVDRFEDVHYIVMEYFEGQNLRQLVDKEGPLDYEDAANYIRQAALGLADAHKRGVIHRDVKPENIVVDEHDFVKILDLGLALLDDSAFNQGSTPDEDKILGTADYLAPEQALDSHNVDARADIYGLGATLYFCLTGKPPFPFGTISERLLAHQRKEPASIFNERPDAPVDLVEICAKMMAKKPENRVQSALQVAEIMKQWLVRNGFAQLCDFAYDKNAANSEDDEILELISHSDAERRFLLNSDNATELGFERGGANFRLSDAELADVAYHRSEDAVDLYDTTESGGSISKLKTASHKKLRESSASDNIVLSKKADIEITLDPLEFALNEIADTTKTSLVKEDAQNDATASASGSTGASGVGTRASGATAAQNRAPDPTTGGSRPNLRETPNARGPAAAQEQPRVEPTTPVHERPKPIETNEPDEEWYKNVPIWFWTVVIAGYALAIFLAGVLFTLLLNLN
ncbi:MAG: serine/threonine protein kinase [Thermoguttaceae bacterium]|nr:serine/threonine protein kinase [Thermoguttaceae bacterium]